MIKEYEINSKTQALIPSDEQTLVYENGIDFIVDKPISKIMDDSCKYFGSTLHGRQQGTYSLTGISYKAPIIIEESRTIIFFPTSSPRMKNCHWISLNNLKSYVFEGTDKVRLIFTDQNEIIIPVSYGIIDNQVLRASKLELILRKRLEFEKNV